ncbi:MAG: hypothetical protein WDN00_14760 [Limisphaerales bacterium]
MGGQPLIPFVSASSQPERVLAYSGLWNGLKNHEAVFGDEIKQDCSENSATEQ